MAFWKYDQFPYMLSGKIKHFKDDGTVYIEAYKGSFKPVIILPLSAREELSKRLNNLQCCYEQDLKDLNGSWVYLGNTE